ncbi:hypothetical protein D3C75_1043330 [compost metagenome]
MNHNRRSGRNHRRCSAGQRVLNEYFARTDEDPSAEVILKILGLHKGLQGLIRILRKLQHVNQLVQFLLGHMIGHLAAPPG